ncbi:MAG: POTRA domain-containing protein [Chitinophagaceae bacterium]
MRANRTYYFLFIVFHLLLQQPLWSQPVAADPSPTGEISPVSVAPSRDEPPSMTPFAIGEIIISGNKVTKAYIIERELPFRRGDSVNLSSLVGGFEVARQQLMNTTLFNEVVISLRAFRGYAVDILIEVKERWYIFPLPYFKLVDRNVAEWEKNNFSLGRVNYGFKFNHHNFSGRNDKLRLWFINGYTKQFQFQYEQPYADPTLRHGFKVGFSYSFTREVNYATRRNEQMFSDSLGGMKRTYAFIDYLYRPGLRTFNAFRIAWAQEEVEQQLLNKNPFYYAVPKRRMTYLELSYKLNYFKVDYIPFPLTGWMGEVNFLKKGLNRDMNLWQVGVKYTKGWKVWPNTWYSTQVNGLLRLPFDQPYVNQRLFGYSDFYLRAMDNYVVDGVAGLLGKQNLRRSIGKLDIPTGLRSRAHTVIPFRFYARVFVDVGYAHHPNDQVNSLANHLLYTAGIGLDLVSFYDFVLRIDYGVNQLRENGLFLHVKTDF